MAITDLDQALAYLSTSKATIDAILADIKAALTEKEVTVTEPLKVSDIAGYINLIGS